MGAFIFSHRADVKAVHWAELLPGIKSEDALLEALSVALRFPDYFGRNWNALNECICDLSWLPPGDVALIHNDLPMADNRASLSMYLSVLRDAVGNWSTRGSNLIYASPEKWDATGERELLVKRRFFVVFPPDIRSTVESLLN
jgi:hypothetical protein